MSTSPQLLQEARKYYGRIQGLPRFLLQIHAPTNQTSVLKLPDKFVDAVGAEIPKNVILQFPNGREIHVHYRKNLKSLAYLNPLYSELGNGNGFFLVISYKGLGVFSVDVIDSGHTEIEYTEMRRVPRAPVFHQDTAGGKRWKFLEYATGPLHLNGSITLPSSFMDRFGHIIPSSVKIKLVNGEDINGKFLRNESLIFGLLPIVQKKYVSSGDILIFNYSGNGEFDLSIYDESRTEKLFNVEVVEIDTDSEDDSDNEDVSAEVIAVSTEDSSSDSSDSEEDDNDVDVGVEFSKALSKSNINRTSHGVHIPVRVKPSGRSWVAGETVTLRHFQRHWTVGIVTYGNKARFSSGWNKFCLDNNLKKNQTVSFTFFEAIDGLEFVVEFFP